MVDGITVTERKYVNQADGQATISFQLPYRDWLKLENSNEWHRVKQRFWKFKIDISRSATKTSYENRKR